MAEYILDVLNQTSKLDWAFPFQRTGAFPLDRSSLFTSYEDAVLYASGVANDERKLGGTSYVGQPISVYDASSNTVTLYIINPDRSLQAVGSSSLGDGVSVEIVDGKIQLKDFGIGYYAYVPATETEASKYVYTEGFKEGLEPRVRLEGENFVIAWYEPSNETIEDISANLETLQGKIEKTEQDIATNAANIDNNSAAIEDIYSGLDEKANAKDVYTKAQTDSKIKEEIDKLDHLKRTTVAGLESIDVLAEDADQYIYMVPNVETGNYDEYMVINGELEKVGDWTIDLSDYATTSDLEKKVDKVDGYRLISEAEANKLSSIENGAQENYIKDVDSEFSVDTDGKLHLETISQDKVDNLSADLTVIRDDVSYTQTQLSKKVDKVNGSRLMTEEEGEKLANIQDLIKGVNDTNFSVTAEGELNLKDIDQSKVTGLSEALEGKVNKVVTDGKDWILLSPENQEKLAALVIGEGGGVEISGKVNADNVEGLSSWITTHRDTIPGLLSALDAAKLNTVSEGAEKNFIASVDTSEFSVSNRHLELVSVSPSKVSGLSDLLNAKADKSVVTQLSTDVTSLQSELALLGDRTTYAENQISEINTRLTWQPL
jgi:hypothetical protein